MRAWRWPILVVVVVCLAAAVVVEVRRGDDVTTTAAASELSRLMPVVTGPDAASSVWFCAGGSATGSADGPAEQTVTILNAGTETVQVRLTAMTDTGERTTSGLELGPASRRDVPVAELIEADWASVLVEADGPEVAVEHRVESPLGTAVAACSSRTSDSWYVPAGTTRAGTRQILAVFNPFPDDAVVDIAFETDDGSRTPEEYRPKLIRGGHVAALDITDVVTLRGQVSAVLDARAGRVAVDVIQTWDGTDGAPSGITLSPAAPALASQWVFAQGAPVVDDQVQQIVAFNPMAELAEGEVLVTTDGGEPVEAFAMVVRPEAYTVVDVAGDGRLPAETGFWASAVVYGGPQVAVGQVLGVPGAGGGISSTLGSPLTASRWLVPTGSVTTSGPNRLTVVNPGSDDVDVEVQRLADGEREAEGGTVRVPAGARVDVEVDAASTTPFGLEVTASGPVVVEHEMGAEVGSSRSLALPVDGTLSLPPEPQVATATDTTPGTGLPPDLDLEVPGTAPGTTPGTTPGTVPSTVPTTASSAPPASDTSSTSAPAAPPP